MVGFAIDEGSGEIVPLGDPREAQGNFGSSNMGVYGIARNNSNLKEGIAPLESTLSKLLTMNVVSYRYRQDTGIFLPTGTHYGVIAQELEPLFPELVSQNTARIPNMDAADAGPSTSTTTIDFKSVNHTEMIPVLIKAIQEQQQQIEVLRAEIERLKNN